jgi:hypothetical protein
MVLLEGILLHRVTRLSDDAFSLQRCVEPVAEFDREVLPVWAIVQNPYQGILVPDPQVIAFAIDELEQLLLDK